MPVPDPHSKKFVHFPSIEGKEKCWLLWTKRGESVCLRDYSNPQNVEPHDLTLQEADKLLSNARENDGVVELTGISNIPVNDKEAWHILQNFQNGISGFVDVPVETLQAKFKDLCYPCLQQDAKKKLLRAILKFWIQGMAVAKDRNGQLNPYDAKEMGERPKNHGEHWQAKMLDFSRHKGQIKYVSFKDHADLDFSFLIPELVFSISKNDRPLGMESRKSIKPDGLGIRKNGFLTVVEVKGPDDEASLMAPILQAACAATAVVAKRDMLINCLKNGFEKRPAFPNVKIPKRSSIGLHLLTANTRSGRQLEEWSSEIETQCQTLLESFDELEYIAFSFVEPDDTKGFTEFKIDQLVRRKPEYAPSSLT